MATTTFVDGVTIIPSAWLNDVNGVVYTGTLAASKVVNTPAGSIAAVTVQAALDELDTEKLATSAIGTTVQAYDAQLATLAAITTTQAADLAALSTFTGTLLNDADQKTALTTLGAPLNTVSAKAAAYTVIAADRGKFFDCTGTFTLSLTAAATLGDGFGFAVRNSGTGVITLDPDLTELIDGAATVALAAGESGFVAGTGTAWRTVGKTAAQKILQVVHFDTGALATGTTTIPGDDTIPQQTEGDQYMSLAITPKAADSTLRIDVTFNFSCSGSAIAAAPLFRDAVADAIGTGFVVTAADQSTRISFSDIVSSGSTAATTFKVRAGTNTATTITFNGRSAARLYGGSVASSIRITEIAA